MYKGEGIAVIIISVIDTALSLDIAQRSQWDEEFFYKTFGIDGEILIDHAWGIEPVTMQEIKSYRSEAHTECYTKCVRIL